MGIKSGSVKIVFQYISWRIYIENSSLLQIITTHSRLRHDIIVLQSHRTWPDVPAPLQLGIPKVPVSLLAPSALYLLQPQPPSHLPVSMETQVLCNYLINKVKQLKMLVVKLSYYNHSTNPRWKTSGSHKVNDRNKLSKNKDLFFPCEIKSFCI